MKAIYRETLKRYADIIIPEVDIIKVAIDIITANLKQIYKNHKNKFNRNIIPFFESKFRLEGGVFSYEGKRL